MIPEGSKEGNFVVSASPALRPSAERKRRWRDCFGRVEDPALPTDSASLENATQI
jgi:hypothetical protein